MVLDPATLAAALERDWLPPDDGPWHGDAPASAGALAGAVAGWFAGAQAAGIPCATAAARRGQLAGQLVPALQAQDAVLAGQQIALALALYVTGQSFGPGVAGPPLATAVGGSSIAGALAAIQLPRSARAQQVAGAAQLVAVSAVVAFPQPPFTAPIT